MCFDLMKQIWLEDFIHNSLYLRGYFIKRMSYLRTSDVFVLVEVIGGHSAIVLACIQLLINVLIVMVFLKTKLKLLDAFRYLAALAIADILHLVAIVIVAMYKILYDYELCNYFLDERYDGFITDLSTTLENTSGICSEWLLVAFAYNRCSSIKYLLNWKMTWFGRNTKTIILTIFSISFTISLIFQIICKTLRFECFLIITTDYTIRFLIAGILMVYFNVAAVYLILKKRRKAEQTLRSSSKQNKRTSALIASTVMWLLAIPLEISTGILVFLMAKPLVISSSLDLIIWAFKWRPYFYLIKVFNGCLDFFIYCTSGKTFRGALIELFSSPEVENTSSTKTEES